MPRQVAHLEMRACSWRGRHCYVPQPPSQSCPAPSAQYDPSRSTCISKCMCQMTQAPAQTCRCFCCKLWPSLYIVQPVAQTHTSEVVDWIQVRRAVTDHGRQLLPVCRPSTFLPSQAVLTCPTR